MTTQSNQLRPQDLRIGNLVTVNLEGGGENRYFHITGIHQTIVPERSITYNVCIADLGEKLTRYSVFIEYIKPIPLTKEILLKCGFTKKHDSWYSNPVGNFLFGCDEIYKNRYDLHINNETGGIRLRIYYVNQLQNIVASLTDKELEVKL